MNKGYAYFFVTVFVLFVFFHDKASLIEIHYPYKIIMMRPCSRSSYIIFIRDKKGKLLLIKQKTTYFRSLMSSLHSALASKMYESIPDIRGQQVDILSKNDRNKFPLRYKNFQASIHTLVPGKPVCQLFKTLYKESSELKRFFLHFNLAQKKEHGLTLAIIKLLRRHPDLPHLVALSMLVGDYDCENKNIFYDQKTNHFFLIDMDRSFNRNLCETAYENLKKMVIRRATAFSRFDLISLNQIAQTLALLIEKNPIADVMNHARSFAQKFDITNPEDHAYVERLLKKINSFLHLSYASGKKVIGLINCIVSKNSALINKNYQS